MKQEVLRVAVVDDHPVVRQGTRTILEAAGFDVVVEAETAEQALELMEEHRPDVVLADIRLPQMSGIELATAVRRIYPEVKVLAISAYANPGYAKATLNAGAAGYLLKTASDEELVAAVRSVSLGATVLDSSISADLIAGEPLPHHLTEREREILFLVVAGLANKEIAFRLNVSKRTVDAHLGHLFTKLGLSTRAALVAWAARQGIIDE